jgi:hypothetical protein
MERNLNPETEIENKIGRICGAVFEAILSTLTEEQDLAARDFLREVIANPNIYRDDKRILASIAGYSDEELDQLMTDLYGPRPPYLRVVTGGAA